MVPARTGAAAAQVLTYVQRFPAAWACAPLHKAVLPRLWAFLRHGCHGSATASYPCAVLLLASLPPTAMAAAARPGLLPELLASLWQGRAFCLGKGAAADAAAATTAYRECLTYALLHWRALSDGVGRAEEDDEESPWPPTQLLDDLLDHGFSALALVELMQVSEPYLAPRHHCTALEPAARNPACGS